MGSAYSAQETIASFEKICRLPACHDQSISNCDPLLRVRFSMHLLNRGMEMSGKGFVLNSKVY
jgi:hypothetical protein